MSERDDELPDELRDALDLLDARARAAAERMDVTRVTATVAQRLKTGDREAVRPGDGDALRWMRIAAAVALLIVGSVTAAMMLSRTDSAAARSGLPVAMDSLSVADSLAVLAAIDEAGGAADSARVARSGVTIDDLNEQELRALLQALETEESL